MTHKRFPVLRVREVLVTCLLLAFACVAAQEKALKYDAALIWATDLAKSPNPNHKPVPPEIRRKLSELPLKWKHFFVVTNVTFSITLQGSKEVVMSDRCRIRVADLGKNQVEVSLIGQGQRVLKRTQPLPKGDMLVLGGNAPDESGWLVVLKRVE